MFNLPCCSQKAAEELQSIIQEKKYELNLLPATSTNGKPIKPANYHDRLAGALVFTEATFSSEFYLTKGHQFYADVASISILHPPTIIVTDSPGRSPSKKRRFEIPKILKYAHTPV
jgi:hypothetical protein